MCGGGQGGLQCHMLILSNPGVACLCHLLFIRTCVKFMKRLYHILFYFYLQCQMSLCHVSNLRTLRTLKSGKGEIRKVTLISIKAFYIMFRYNISGISK